MASPQDMSMLSSPQQTSYYQEPPNDITGGLPINLDSLRDGPPGSKPFYPYSTLIRYAIKGSPNQKLLLEDIYYAIESRFPYFRSAPAGWKNSVRHNLSLNPCFEKIPRPLTDRGKGSYWTVNDNVDPRTGVHRIRKKRNKAGAAQQQQQQLEQQQQQQQLEHQSPQPQSHPQQPEQEEQPQSEQDPPQGSAMAMPYEPPVDMQFPMHQEQYPSVTGGPYILEDPGLSYVNPNELRPEMDEHGQPDWRNMWHNELAKLKAFTLVQDKSGADPEWYRMMLARVRGAVVIGPDGLPIPPGHHPHGHPIDHDIPEDGEEEHDPDLEQEPQ